MGRGVRFGSLGGQDQRNPSQALVRHCFTVWFASLRRNALFALRVGAPAVAFHRLARQRGGAPLLLTTQRPRTLWRARMFRLPVRPSKQCGVFSAGITKRARGYNLGDGGSTARWSIS
jgi:hypothetical protein